MARRFAILTSIKRQKINAWNLLKARKLWPISSTTWIVKDNRKAVANCMYHFTQTDNSASTFRLFGRVRFDRPREVSIQHLACLDRLLDFLVSLLIKGVFMIGPNRPLRQWFPHRSHPFYRVRTRHMLAYLGFITVQGLELPITPNHGTRPTINSFRLWTHVSVTDRTINVPTIFANPLRWVVRALRCESHRQYRLLVHSSHPSRWLLALPRSRSRCIQPCLSACIGALQVFTRGRSNPPGKGSRSDGSQYSRLNRHDYLTDSSLLLKPEATSEWRLNYSHAKIIRSIKDPLISGISPRRRKDHRNLKDPWSLEPPSANGQQHPSGTRLGRGLRQERDPKFLHFNVYVAIRILVKPSVEFHDIREPHQQVV